MLVKDSNAQTPKRLDLSGLKPDKCDDIVAVAGGAADTILPSLQIRKGSLSELRDMEYLTG